MQTNGLCLIENTVTVVLSERKVVNEGLKAAEDLTVCRCALVLPWSFDAAPRGFKLLTVVCVRYSQFPGVVFPAALQVCRAFVVLLQLVRVAPPPPPPPWVRPNSHRAIWGIC